MAKRYFLASEVEEQHFKGNIVTTLVKDAFDSIVEYTLIVEVDGLIYPLTFAMDTSDGLYIYENQMVDSVEEKTRMIVQEYWVDDAGIEYC
jgi:hypothetical protein